MTYKGMGKYAVIALTFMFHTFFVFLLPSHATSKNSPGPSFSVSPAIINIVLSPGKTYIHTVRVKNLTTIPLPIHIEMDQPIESEDSAGVSSITSWVHPDISDTIIPSGEEKPITVTINTPSNIPLGGYYGTLFFQPLIPVKNSASQTVQTKVGVLMLASVGVPDLSAKADITSMQITKDAAESGIRNLTFKVKNQSLYHFSAKPIIYIKPIFGSGQKYEIPEKIILPGKTRNWNERLNWPFGNFDIYRVELRVSVGNGKQISYKKMIYDIPVLETGIALLIIGIGLILFSKRHNLRKAFNALVSGK